jgi:hypothetical protein
VLSDGDLDMGVCRRGTEAGLFDDEVHTKRCRAEVADVVDPVGEHPRGAGPQAEEADPARVRHRCRELRTAHDRHPGPDKRQLDSELSRNLCVPHIRILLEMRQPGSLASVLTAKHSGDKQAETPFIPEEMFAIASARLLLCLPRGEVSVGRHLAGIATESLALARLHRADDSDRCQADHHNPVHDRCGRQAEHSHTESRSDGRQGERQAVDDQQRGDEARALADCAFSMTRATILPLRSIAPTTVSLPSPPFPLVRLSECRFLFLPPI